MPHRIASCGAVSYIRFMFVKICGIRTVEAALMAAEAGADAIGLNFYEKSPRVVAPAVAAEIVSRLRALPGGAVELVGVFVNHSADEIRAIAKRCGLRAVQLHGDEPPELVAELAAEFRVVKAFRVGDEGLEGLARHLDACRRLGTTPWACLIDAKVEGMYGGTGHTIPWEKRSREYQTAAWPPLILAGGLRPDNVAEAIRVVRPWGVDVASGVESSLACKDATLVRQFVQNARKST
jgi:phosphoribosylanthranilate isomerase